MTLTESAFIVNFLTDLYPSHLTPTIANPSDPDAIKAAHTRYRQTFFTDTYFTKVNPLMFKLVGADAGAAQAKVVDDIINLLEKEIEPLFTETEEDGKGPYFGGSETLTIVEVCDISPVFSLLLSR